MEISSQFIIVSALVALFFDPITTCNSQEKYKDSYRNCTTRDCVGTSACLTIYQYENFGGWQQCFSFKQNECLKFDYWWRTSTPSKTGRVASVNTHQTCIRLYEKSDCSGGAVEIHPNDASQRDLRKLNFENYADSASSCSRHFKFEQKDQFHNVINDEKRCKIQNIFYVSESIDAFSTASDEVLSTMDKIAELVTSGFAIVIPGIDVFYNGLKFFVGMLKPDVSTESLIDQSIIKALGENAKSQIFAKIAVVEKKIKSVLSSRSNLELQKIEISMALHSCEEIFALFLDPTYSFRKNVLISSPHLVVFSSIYMAVAKLAHKILPSKRTEIVDDIKQLTELNKLYKRMAIEERQNKIAIYKNGPYPGDMSSVFLPDSIFDEGFFNEESVVVTCPKYRCYPCFKLTQDSIEVEIEQFFRKPIRKLEQFS